MLIQSKFHNYIPLKKYEGFNKKKDVIEKKTFVVKFFLKNVPNKK
jgi:hypothetical protein